jgi:class 3 adenylate cyclase
MSGFDDRSFQAFLNDLQTGSLSYEDARSRYRELGEAIRHRYEREVTALALDVVQSVGAKSESALEGQVTFDAYHHWVEGTLAHFGCEGSFAWAGDGLLAVFSHPEPAVAAGRHLLDALPAFNARSNRLPRPLQLRIGVHTGPILTDQSAGLGKIASQTFDLAGHLQKAAAPNQMLVSERTFAHLRELGQDLMPVPAGPPAGGYHFAYPPHVTLMGAPALSAPVVPNAPPRSAQASFVPWLLAVGGIAVAVGVLATIAVLGPRSPGVSSQVGTNVPAVYQGQPVSGAPVETPTARPAANAPGQPAVPPVAPASQPASDAPVERELPPPAKVPPEWEPSRQLWRSPDADSGVPPRTLPSSPEQKWLLSIGIGHYQESVLSAPGAGLDARYAAAVLQQAAGIPGGHTMVLTEEQATLGMCKQGFKWLQQNAASGRDTVYVYLAGAAMLAPDRPGLRHPGGTSYALFPYDARLSDPSATAIYGADVAEWLGAIPAQTMVLIVDTNHADGIDLPLQPDAGRGLALLATCGVMQQARAKPGQQAGLFPELLAAALKGAADGNHDGRVGLSELKSYLERELGRITLGAQTLDLRGGFGGAPPEVIFATPRG